MNRHHVHLSLDKETAREVASRHGAPIVFVVDAARMCREGHRFHVSTNDVWLTDSVPPKYLARIP